MSFHKVYVVILNWNGAKDTIKCLESFKKVRYQNYQLILVDNGSTPENLLKLNKWCKSNYKTLIKYNKDIAISGGIKKTELILDKESAKDRLLIIENNDNLGFAAGNNVALKYALSKEDNGYVLLLNNDTIVEPDFLEYLVYFMDYHTEYVACTPKICLNSDRDVIWNCGGKITWFGSRHYYFAGRYKNEVPSTKFIDITFVTGCALFFKPVLTGILSENFFFGEEDFEFSLRLKKEKKKIACINNSLIYHKVGGTINNETHNKLINKVFLFYASRLINHKNFYKSPFLEILRLINLSYAALLVAFKYKHGITKGLKFVIDVNKFIKSNNQVNKDKFSQIMKLELFL